MKSFQNYTFIVKPSKGKGGKGIFLIKKFSDLHKIQSLNEYIIQKYIENPILVGGKKFDLRVYLVLKSIKPLEAYICEEGLARFCTNNYKKPDYMNLKNVYMHLTNYSLNKFSSKFISADEDFFNDKNSSKRLMSSIFLDL